jgi:hypothetical protein
MPAKKAAPRKGRKTTKKRPAKRTPGQRKPETQPTPKKPKLPSLPLLILECDADRLEREGMAMGDQLHKIAQVLPVNNRNLELALINSQDDLLKAFAKYAVRYSSIKVIVVIGHSDAWSVRISTPNNAVLDWPVVANWFEKLKPQYLVFVACNAGQYPAKAAFFEKLKSLKAMFASPVKISRLQAEIIKILVPYLLLAKRIDPDAIKLGQWLAFLRDRTIILYCTRRDSDWNKLIQFGAGLSDL